MLAKDLKDLNLYDASHIGNNEKIDYLKEVEEAAFKEKEIINTETGFSELKSLYLRKLVFIQSNNYKYYDYGEGYFYQSFDDLNMKMHIFVLTNYFPKQLHYV